MARGYHRLSWRARHVLRQFGKSKNITLQRLHLHELRHAISRKHRFKGPKGKPALGKAGLYQRLSRKGRKLITRLRHSRSWQVQKQTVTELEREVQRGERVALAKQARAQRLADRAEKIAKRAQQRGRQFRQWAQRKQEPVLAKAERKQSEREKGTRKPSLTARMRQSRQAGGRKMYNGPFSSARAHRRWGRQNARRQVPGIFARFAARRGWTRLQDGHHWTPAARRAEGRSTRPTPGRPAQPRTVRAPSAPRTQAPRAARPRTPVR